ncbi:alpha-L-fucosidase [Frateuria aurantia]
MNTSFRLLSICMAAGLALPAVAASPTAGGQAVPPSVTPPDAMTIERQWVAANRPFDAARRQILDQVDARVEQGPFSPDWATLVHYRTPQWYRDAKFGIFIHWGVYSVPAFKGEWYPRWAYKRTGENSERYRYQVEHYGAMPEHGYKDLIPLFKAEHFDPDAWAALFSQAGARFVVPVAEHHDGFAMYNSRLSDWTAAKMGPHRDVIGELAKAIRAHGMKLGLSSHRAEHDWFYDNGRTFNSDVNDPRYAALYGPAHALTTYKADGKDVDGTYVSQAFLNDWLARTAEIVQDYHPDLLYFDWWVGQPSFRNALATAAAYFYDTGIDRKQPVVLDYKFDALPSGGATFNVERGDLADIRKQPWQAETSISPDSWGYAQDDTYKDPNTLLHLLIDVVSKNGDLLLNIGPRADGTIPDEAVHILQSLGEWLHSNGASIYGTRPWIHYGEGPTRVVPGTMHDTETQAYTSRDFRFTVGDGALFATEMAWPADGHAVLTSIPRDLEVSHVELLATGQTVAFHKTAQGWDLKLPARPEGLAAYVFKVRFSRPLSPAFPDQG